MKIRKREMNERKIREKRDREKEEDREWAIVRLRNIQKEKIFEEMRTEYLETGPRIQS